MLCSIFALAIGLCWPKDLFLTLKRSWKHPRCAQETKQKLQLLWVPYLFWFCPFSKAKSSSKSFQTWISYLCIYQAVLKTSCFWQCFCSLCLNNLDFSGCQAKQFALAVFAWLFSKILHIPDEWIRCFKKKRKSSWVLCGHLVFNIDLWTETWFYTVLLNHYILSVWCLSFRIHCFPWVYTANIKIWWIIPALRLKLGLNFLIQ